MNSLEKMRQFIFSRICFVSITVYLKMIANNVISQPNMTTTHVFCIYELSKSIVNGIYKDFVLKIF